MRSRMLSGALALAFLGLGLQGCAFREPGPAPAPRAVRTEPLGPYVLGVSESAGPCLLRSGGGTARVARCSLVGTRLTCTDQEVRCEVLPTALDTVRR